MKKWLLFKLAILLLLIMPIMQTFGRDGNENFELRKTSSSILSLSKNTPANEDLTVCSEIVVLHAVTPSQGPGVWSTDGNAHILSPLSESTQAWDLSNGTNTFTWTPVHGTPVIRTIVYNRFGVGAELSINTSVDKVTVHGGDSDKNTVFCWSFDESRYQNHADILNPASPTSEIYNLKQGRNELILKGIKDGCYDDWTTYIDYSGTSKSSPAGENQTICSSSAVLFEVLPSQGPGIWSTNGSAQIDTPSHPSTSVSRLDQGINTFIWTPLQGTPATRTITNNSFTIDAGPDQNTAANSADIHCSVPSGTKGLSWSWDDEFTTSMIQNPGGIVTKVLYLVPGANILKLKAIKDGCLASSKTVVNYIGSEQETSSNENIKVCGSAAILSEVLPSQGKGRWSTLGSANIVNPSGASTQVTKLEEGNNVFTWTPEKGKAVFVTITRTPFSISAGPDLNTKMANATVQAPIPAGTSACYWSVESGTGYIATPGSFKTDIVNLSPGQNKFKLTATKNGCIATADLTINYIGGSEQTVCSDYVHLSDPKPSEGPGIWTSSGSAAISCTSARTTTADHLEEGINTFTWTPEHGTPITRSVTYIKPITIDAGPKQTVRVNNASLRANIPEGTSNIIWINYESSNSDQNIILTPSKSQTEVLNLRYGENTFKLSAFKNGCWASSETTIYYDGTTGTSVPADANQTVCSSEAALLEALPSQGPGIWSTTGRATIYTPSNPNAFARNLDAGVNTFTWTPIHGTPVSRTITNKSFSVDAGINQSLWTNNAVLQGSAPEGTQVWWSMASGCGEIQDYKNLKTDVYNLSIVTNTLKLFGVKDGCTASDGVVIKFTDQDKDQIVCSPSAVIYEVFATATSGTWVSDKEKVTISNPSNYLTSVSNLQEGLNTFKWVPVNGTPIIHTITYKPFSIHAGADQNVYTDNTKLHAIVPSGTLGYSWSVVEGKGDLVSPGGIETDVQNLQTGVNKFKLTAFKYGCMASALVTVNSLDPKLNIKTCEDNYQMKDEQGISKTGTWSVEVGNAEFDNPHSFATTIRKLALGMNTLKFTPSSGDAIIYKITNNKFTASAGNTINVTVDSARIAGTAPANANSIQWSFLEGFGTIKQNDVIETMVYNLYPGINTLKLRVQKDGCTSSSTVNINYQDFKPNSGSNYLTCNDTAELKGSIKSGSTAVWSTIKGSGIIESASSPITKVKGLSQGENIFRLTATKNGMELYDDVTITNNGFKIFAGQDANTIKNEVTITDATAPSKAKLGWTHITAAGLVHGNDILAPTITDLQKGINIFQLTAEQNGCTATANVQINYIDFKPSAGIDNIACADTFNLKGVIDPKSTGVWSTVKGQGVFDHSTSPTTTVRGLSLGENIFRLTATIDGDSRYDDIAITYLTPPTADFSIENQILTQPNSTVKILNRSSSGTAYSYLWNWGNGAAFTSNLMQETISYTYDPVVFPTGKFDIKLTVSDGKCSSTAVHSLRIDKTMSASEASPLHADIRLFPNPSSGNTHLEVDADKESNFNIVISNAQSQIIRREKITNTRSLSRTYDLSPGVYMFWIESEKKTKVMKLIVQ